MKETHLNEKNMKPESGDLDSVYVNVNISDLLRRSGISLPRSIHILWPHPRKYQNHDQKHQKARGQRG